MERVSSDNTGKGTFVRAFLLCLTHKPQLSIYWQATPLLPDHMVLISYIHITFRIAIIYAYLNLSRNDKRITNSFQNRNT